MSVTIALKLSTPPPTIRGRTAGVTIVKGNECLKEDNTRAAADVSGHHEGKTKTQHITIIDG